MRRCEESMWRNQQREGWRWLQFWIVGSVLGSDLNLSELEAAMAMIFLQKFVVPPGMDDDEDVEAVGDVFLIGVMDPPADDIDLKLEEEKDSGPLFHCEYFDMDIVHKIGQSLLPGLASACIDNTIGGLFKTPASVAVDLRREMVDYLIQRSENFVAESVVLEGGPDVDVSVDPYNIIPDLVDDFVSSKRNFFSRVSGWILSEKREDWIDDLVQEMEVNGFWLSSRRDSVAQTLLKNLDFKNTYHCSMSFRSEEDLERHKPNCGFRTMSCENEGCDSSFSAAQMEHHDSTCPFKILPCEQNCVDSIMRREMDRHCITICPMKLVKCPFHAVGCQSTVPQSLVEGHRSESLDEHLIYILKGFHKETPHQDLKERAKEIEKLCSREQLASTRDARSLTNLIKRLEARLGPLKIKPKEEEDNNKDLIDDKKEEAGTKHVRFENPPSKKEEVAAASISVQEENPKDSVGEPIGKLPEEEDLKESPGGDHEKEETVVHSHSKASDHNDSSHEKGELVDSSTNTNNVSAHSVQEENPKEITKDDEQMGKLSKEENLIESPERVVSPAEGDEQMGKLLKEESLDEDQEKGETINSRSKVDDHNDSDHKQAKLVESPKDLGLPAKADEQMGKLPKEEVVDPIKEEHYVKSTINHEEINESVDEGGKHGGSTARNEVSTKSTNGE
ncbi:tnf receptor-associated factor family protein ddb_g0290931 [Phtheirospermum japonicum]|uniref:Tnf receptor-associated factor family protein ddb_g0290931 n=1 Tax=Phtheirospermum japonicum TaxID=374723 RepID=A0A830C3Y8_9LAMI|nr:tnf receptor-associated factor family protein ddb_g0290931 [Phtheirospermum japonicum]